MAERRSYYRGPRRRDGELGRQGIELLREQLRVASLKQRIPEARANWEPFRQLGLEDRSITGIDLMNAFTSSPLWQDVYDHARTLLPTFKDSDDVQSALVGPVFARLGIGDVVRRTTSTKEKVIPLQDTLPIYRIIDREADVIEKKFGWKMVEGLPSVDGIVITEISERRTVKDIVTCRVNDRGFTADMIGYAKLVYGLSLNNVIPNLVVVTASVPPEKKIQGIPGIVHHELPFRSSTFRQQLAGLLDNNDYGFSLRELLRRR